MLHKAKAIEYGLNGYCEEVKLNGIHYFLLCLWLLVQAALTARYKPAICLKFIFSKRLTPIGNITQRNDFAIAPQPRHTVIIR